MKSYCRIGMLCLLVSLFLLNGCGGKKYADAEESYKDMINVMDEYVAQLDKSQNAKDVARAMNSFADKMEALAPRMEKLAEKYPELENASDLPEELKEWQEKATAAAQKMAASMMKIMPYMSDPEVQKAQERMAAGMTQGQQ